MCYFTFFLWRGTESFLTSHISCASNHMWLVALYWTAWNQTSVPFHRYWVASEGYNTSLKALGFVGGTSFLNSVR